MKTEGALWRGLLVGVAVAALMNLPASAQQQTRPNVVMLMTDDTGWNDFGAYSGGGKGLGHPTPNVDKIAEEGATFKAGRMGEYKITKDPTRPKGLRILMGPFTIYNKDNIEAAAK